jgi:Protein of unknown function (DUF4019)
VSVRLTCAVLIVLASEIAGVGDVPAQGTSSNASPAINITSDSAPGWLPSERQRQDVIKSAGDYLSALDESRYEAAYAMMSESNRRTVPFERFIDARQKFHARSGSLKQRSILKVTWTRNPAAAPLPGIYAAIDVASRYENIDRHCGYVVLYKKTDGENFQVMRQESNFIDNAMAQKIEQQKSRAELDKLWAKLAANCPNYDISSPKPQ